MGQQGMKTFNEFNKTLYEQEEIAFTTSLKLQESSEWETRHQEFVSAGNNATPEHINSLLNNLKDAGKKASGKRGVLNNIFGKKSNADLARSAHAADYYHASISKLKKSAKDTEDRKTLGQHITYAKSLVSRMNESEGLDEMDFSSMEEQGMKTFNEFNKTLDEGKILDVEREIKKHDAKDLSTMSPADRFSHEVRRKQLLQKRARAQREYHKKMNNESVEEIDEADFASMASQLKKYGGKEEIKDTPKKVQSRSSVASNYTMTGHKEKQVATGKQYHKVLPDYDDEDEVKAAKKSTVSGAEPQEKRGRGRPKGVGAKSGFYKPRDPAKKAESAAKAAATKAANKAAKAALTKEDCDEIFEGLDFNDMIEFMLEEDVVALDELSKETLSSYMKTANAQRRGLASGLKRKGIHNIKDLAAAGDKEWESGMKLINRNTGVERAKKRLEKNEEIEQESEQSSNTPEINESTDKTVAYYAARINTNLIKE